MPRIVVAPCALCACLLLHLGCYAPFPDDYTMGPVTYRFFLPDEEATGEWTAHFVDSFAPFTDGKVKVEKAQGHFQTGEKDRYTVISFQADLRRYYDIMEAVVEKDPRLEVVSKYNFVEYDYNEMTAGISFEVSGKISPGSMLYSDSGDGFRIRSYSGDAYKFTVKVLKGTEHVYLKMTRNRRTVDILKINIHTNERTTLSDEDYRRETGRSGIPELE